MKHKRQVAWLAAMLAVSGLNAAAQTVTFSDEEFNDSDWTAEMIVNEAGSSAEFTAKQDARGGNPGAFRRLHHIGRAGSSPREIHVAHLRVGAIYDPQVDGPITGVSYSYDLKNLESRTIWDSRFYFLIFQNDTYYRSALDRIATLDWVPFGRSALDARDFTRISETGPRRPDFSDDAPPLHFGFDSVSRFPSGSHDDSRNSGIDNWSVSVTPQGAPSCRIVPQNVFLPFHVTTAHFVDPDRYRHLVTVEVSLNGAPPPSPAEVSVLATKPILGAPSGSAASTGTAATDGAGRAVLEFTPSADERFDRTDLVASGSVAGMDFHCEGTLVVGTGAILPDVAASSENALARLRRLREMIMVETGVDETDGKWYDGLTGEFLEIVMADPALLLRGRQVLQRYSPLVQALIDKKEARLNNADLREINDLLKLVEVRAGVGLRLVIDLLRARFSRPEAWEQLGVTIIDGQHPSISQHGEPTPRDEPPADGPAAAGADYGNLPLSFEANEGQTDERVHYLSRGPGYNFYLTSQGAVLVNSSIAELPASARAVLGIEFAGASSSPTVKGVERLESKSHYLIGNNPDRWRINVPHYAKVHYQQVYPGVDLVYYGREGELRFDFVVAPGADPNQIGLVFQGVEHLEIDEQGDLSLVRAEGRLEIEKPFVYQQVDGTKQQIAGDYVIGNHGRVRFELAAYDETLPLVIDPVLSYSSYLGGRGEDGIQSIAVDAAGNAYVTGATTSADLPIEGTQTAFAGGGEFSSDIFVTKFNADGTALLYSAFIGGSDDDIGEGIAVDGEGNAYITGATRSADFPTTEAAQTDFAGGGAVFGTDAFVVKLDPMGAVMYSGYLGGADDDGGAAVAVDSEGNSYVAGFTASVDFPVRNALQPANAGGRPFGSDAFVVKLNPTGTAIVYGSYLGGSGDDAANGVSVDDAGNAYLTGVTFSADFPTANPFQQSAGGSADAFVAKVNVAGSALVYSTYLGGESDDMGMGLVVDGAGNAHLTGITGSAGFPLLNAVQAELGGGTPLGFDAFVAKLNAAGSALAYSTYLGGAGIEAGLGIALDPGGNVYVVGETNSSDFPTENPLQLGSGGLNDGFVVKLNPTGSAFDYSTYLGGDDNDSATSVAVDASGNAYIAGLSKSTDAPVTFGAFQTNTAGEADALIAKIVAGTPLPALTTVSAASFSGSLGASPESIVSGFGAGLAGEKVEAEVVPLPTTLAGTTVKVTDSGRTERLAPLFFVSASQINYLIPEGTETGLALVTVERDGQVVASGTVQINPVAPALFSADSSGQGVAAALFLRVAADQSRSEDLIFDPNSRASVPIDLGPDGDRIFLLLFGTGVRGFTAEVTATVDGESVPVLGALPQPEFLGLDQINIGPLPRSLAGRGEVNILLTADGKAANTVTVNVR